MELGSSYHVLPIRARSLEILKLVVAHILVKYVQVWWNSYVDDEICSNLVEFFKVLFEFFSMVAANHTIFGVHTGLFAST